jgi:hypothetical protein
MGGGKPGNTVITLTVDVDALRTNPGNINNLVVFSDNQSDPAENPGHPEAYVSTVNKSSTCQWQGAAKNTTDIINILSIIKKDPSGNDILNTPIPPGLQGSGSGGKTITAIVRGNFINGDEPYTVSFSINSDPTVYSVDPKLQMNP